MNFQNDYIMSTLLLISMPKILTTEQSNGMKISNLYKLVQTYTITMQK